jgi:hypothetical protein
VARASGYSLFLGGVDARKGSSNVYARKWGYSQASVCGVGRKQTSKKKKRDTIKYAKDADAKSEEMRQDRRSPFPG